MFITKTKHTKILNEVRAAHAQTVESLRQELREARDLKTILDKFGGLYVCASGSLLSFSPVTGGVTFTFPDSIAEFVPDHFGGRVIKQEATKVIEISQEGDIKTGLTKRQPEEGYSYVLVRQIKTP